LSIAILICCFTASLSGQNIFSVKGNKTFLNGQEFRAIGLRCSNALLSDETVDDLIKYLDIYREYGLNTISVYFMGSRYSNVNGFNRDGAINEVYKRRMAKIITECDKRKMVVLVGILYWGSGMHDNSNSFYAGWKQENINSAMRSTMKWLTENNYRNIFIDPDNEGMSERSEKYDISAMACEGKKINPMIPIAYNGKGVPPACTDLAIHYGTKTPEKPYIQTEGTPEEYWGEYSKEKALNHYINVGIYTATKIAQQLKDTRELLDSGSGYLFASTWLQNIPPNYDPGGYGTPGDPGMRWWLEFIKNNYKTAK
jgi:hypothetical protein